VKVTFLGVRGSTPAAGFEFGLVGGNTSSLAVAHGDEPPRLILDAGTGIRRMTALLEGAPFRGTILLSHLHWDHVQGLPFFVAGDRDDAHVTLVMPEQGDPADVLRRAMSPPHFPIGPEGLRGRWRYEGMEPGRHCVEGFEVLALEIAHKGGRTFGYRIRDGRSAIAYLPDHATVDPDDDELSANAARLLDGVDLMIHDAQFVEAERAMAAAYGHATIEATLDLAVKAGVGELLLFHHGPDRTDAQLAELVSAYDDAGVRWRVATESTVLRLP
jgi:ribonuclease BN (tRNA processing enzyme)